MKFIITYYHYLKGRYPHNIVHIYSYNRIITNVSFLISVHIWHNIRAERKPRFELIFRNKKIMYNYKNIKMFKCDMVVLTVFIKYINTRNFLTYSNLNKFISCFVVKYRKNTFCRRLSDIHTLASTMWFC